MRHHYIIQIGVLSVCVPSACVFAQHAFVVVEHRLEHAMCKPLCVLGAPSTGGAGCPCACAWRAQTPLCVEVKVVQAQAVHAHVAPCFEMLPDPLPDWSEEAAGSGASPLVDAVLSLDQMTHTH